MDQLLQRRPASDDGHGDARHWRHVPRMNVLPRRRMTGDQRRVLRMALIALLVIEVAYLAFQFHGRGSDQAAIDATREQLQQVQKEIAVEQQAVDTLQAKVNEAGKRVEDAKKVYEQVTANQTSWFAGASALFDTEIEGVRFESMTARPSGEIAVVGVASDLGAMSRFQASLRGAAQFIRLQNISFESSSNALKFIATLKVVR